MLGQVRSCCAAAIAVSLIAAPTGALAAARQPARSAPVSPWLTLSAMTSTSSGASAAAAAQQENAVGLPPPAPLAEILSTIALAIWILLEDDDGGIHLEPISP